MRRHIGLAAWLVLGAPAALLAAGQGGGTLGERLPLESVGPFVGILLSIAIIPLVNHDFWHHHYPKVVLAWAMLTALPFLYLFRGEALHAILDIYLLDYFPFILLLWGLFTVNGGIVLRGSLAGTPGINTLLLLVATASASWIGTTGASVLFIRPLLRANRGRQRKVHLVVFFIFLVSNIGGTLTPLGDPPLFLGFLHGVPFFWTLRLLPHMVFSGAILLVLFYLVDGALYRREGGAQEGGSRERLRVEGLHNLFFLAGILGVVLLSGMWDPRVQFSVYGVELKLQNLVRDAGILAMGALSLRCTQQRLRDDNEFSWMPMREVGYIFAGIFMTIVPTLTILKAGERGVLSTVIEMARNEATYFWITGTLSSFLDNAPTYMAFFSSALGKVGLEEELMRRALRAAPAEWIRLVEDPERIEQFCRYLEAISSGAVFMGAMTYIGNAPNFMVKAIAEESGVRMPSFFGYMAYSLLVLIPLFALLTLFFFT